MVKKPKTRTEDKLFSHKEISVMLNNAVAAASRPESLGVEIPEVRKRKLRYLAQEVVKELGLMVDEDVLRPEEVTFMLAAMGLEFQLSRCKWSEPMPYFEKFCPELLKGKGEPLDAL